MAEISRAVSRASAPLVSQQDKPQSPWDPHDQASIDIPSALSLTRFQRKNDRLNIIEGNLLSKSAPCPYALVTSDWRWALQIGYGSPRYDFNWTHLYPTLSFPHNHDDTTPGEKGVEAAGQW